MRVVTFVLYCPTTTPNEPANALRSSTQGCQLPVISYRKFSEFKDDMGMIGHNYPFIQSNMLRMSFVQARSAKHLRQWQ